MKKNLFNNNDLSIINELSGSTPVRTWWHFSSIIFEYELSYITLECISEPAESPNKYEEVMVCKIFKTNSIYNKPAEANVLTYREKITDIKIVRTLIHFSSAKDNIPVSYNKNSLKARIKRFFSGQEDVISELLVMPSSSYSVFLDNPEIFNDNYPELSNLIDVGLLIEIGDKYLKAFIQFNSYGFPDLNINSLELKADIDKLIKNKYQLINLKT